MIPQRRNIVKQCRQAGVAVGGVAALVVCLSYSWPTDAKMLWLVPVWALIGWVLGTVLGGAVRDSEFRDLRPPRVRVPTEDCPVTPVRARFIDGEMEGWFR